MSKQATVTSTTSTRLYISNLPTAVSWPELRVLLEGAGAVESGLITGRSAAVTMATVTDAAASILTLNGTTFNGRVLIVRQDVEEDGWAGEVCGSGAPATANASGPSNAQQQPLLLTSEDAEALRTIPGLHEQINVQQAQLARLEASVIRLEQANARLTAQLLPVVVQEAPRLEGRRRTLFARLTPSQLQRRQRQQQNDQEQQQRHEEHRQQLLHRQQLQLQQQQQQQLQLQQQLLQLQQLQQLQQQRSRRR
ncbi:hypothetical protein BCR33DRAFT_723062 [Rhizoclosmatium globosum]|uniref:RRM domain-containing protein n=1 Tax=Rhizoclosmatium globosum TaxID=329046 RepID=A0A1Y2BGC2_9FUNG|nr:hypothetical protein BCR33DRAFT_723062 [Rhizoclosmatium globosum]|eukprot:ORY33853.1 hypothetical protein BCR33DRAFT_723062 [Rhizoclosmatium globosum]